MQRRHLLPFLAAPALPLPGLTGRALAQGRTITLVVPYAAGGGTDIVARELLPMLIETTGQNVVIDVERGEALKMPEGVEAPAGMEAPVTGLKVVPGAVS